MTVFVISRSYGDESKYFPVAVTGSKSTADALVRGFGGIVTEVPKFFTFKELHDEGDEDE